MLKHLVQGLVVAAICVADANCDLITFGSSSEFAFSPKVEGAFTYQRVSGTNWGLDGSMGNPAAALIPFNIPNVGETVEFFLTGGGLFTFDSFEIGSLSSDLSDEVTFFGEINNVQTEQSVGFASSSVTFQSMSPGFNAPIDRLLITVTGINNTNVLIDNLSLIAVPEPSAFLYGGLIAVLAGCGYRIKRNVTQHL